MRIVEFGDHESCKYTGQMYPDDEVCTLEDWSPKAARSHQDNRAKKK